MSAKTGDQINDCFIAIAGELAGVNLTKSNSNKPTFKNDGQIDGNIEEDDDEDDDDDSDSEDEKTKKKMKNTVSEKTTQKNKKEDKKDGFSMSQADLKKTGSSGPSKKSTKNCNIF